MREIRLLHFHSYVDADDGLWCLGNSKGIPLYAALDRVSTQAFSSHSSKPALGLLDALADALGEVLVMVVRETVEVTKAALKEGQDNVTTETVKKAKRARENGSANGAEELGCTIDFLAVKKRRLGNRNTGTI
ncbi:MAG: hypothetical protein Q9212_000182 [Teloschistes hypoglaucus]